MERTMIDSELNKDGSGDTGECPVVHGVRRKARTMPSMGSDDQSRLVAEPAKLKSSPAEF